MFPLFVLLVPRLLLRVIGMVGMSPFDSWTWCLRCDPALMFLFKGIRSLGKAERRSDRDGSGCLPRSDLMVSATGVFEILGSWAYSSPRSRQSPRHAWRRCLSSFSLRTYARPASISRFATDQRRPCHSGRFCSPYSLPLYLPLGSLAPSVFSPIGLQGGSLSGGFRASNGRRKLRLFRRGDRGGA